MSRRTFADEPTQPPFAARGRRVPRIAAVTAINEEAGAVTLRWLDTPGGGRIDVPITNSAPGDYGFPTRDDIAICMVDEYETPYIVRFIHTNYRGKVETGEARQIREGERLITSIGGASIYLTQKGSILIQDPTGDEWTIDRLTGTISHRSINYQAVTEAGIIKAGLIKRSIPDGILNQNVDTVIENASSEALAEYAVEVYEVADLEVGIDDTQDPIVTVTIGTLVADDGAGTKTLSSESEEICIDISTKSSVGFQLRVDKSGNMELVTKKVKITSTDIEVTADTIVVNTDDAASIQLGGTSGDNLATKKFVEDIFNQHAHPVSEIGADGVGHTHSVSLGAPDKTGSQGNDSWTDKVKSE